MKKYDLKETLPHGTPDFPVAIYHTAFDSRRGLLASLHYHGEFEFLLASRGSLCVQIEENTYTLSEGEGIFINAGLLHMITAGSGTEHGFIAVVFNYTMICGEYDPSFGKYVQPLMNRLLKVPVKLPPEACGLVREICGAYEAASFGSELYIRQALIRIFYLLVKDSKPTTLPIQNGKSMIIKDTLDYIEKNYHEPISLNELAAHAHISKEYLCRIFRAMSDISPVEYLNRYRIRQSAALLLNTSREISDISLSCGFNTSSYFNKLFLRYMGCTPSAYRRKNTHIE